MLQLPRFTSQFSPCSGKFVTSFTYVVAIVLFWFLVIVEVFLRFVRWIYSPFHEVKLVYDKFSCASLLFSPWRISLRCQRGLPLLNCEALFETLSSSFPITSVGKLLLRFGFRLNPLFPPPLTDVFFIGWTRAVLSVSPILRVKWNKEEKRTVGAAEYELAKKNTRRSCEEAMGREGKIISVFFMLWDFRSLLRISSYC